MSNLTTPSPSHIAIEEKPAAASVLAATTTTTITEWEQVGNCSCLDQVKAATGRIADQSQKSS